LQVECRLAAIATARKVERGVAGGVSFPGGKPTNSRHGPRRRMPAARRSRSPWRDADFSILVTASRGPAAERLVGELLAVRRLLLVADDLGLAGQKAALDAGFVLERGADLGMVGLALAGDDAAVVVGLALVGAVPALDVLQALDFADDHVAVVGAEIVVAVVGDHAGLASVLAVVVAAGGEGNEKDGRQDEGESRQHGLHGTGTPSARPNERRFNRLLTRSVKSGIGASASTFTYM